MDGTYEVKADALEASFDAAARVDDVAELRAEMGAMRARIDQQVAAAGRPALSGAKADASRDFQKHCGSGRTTVWGPYRSSFLPSPLSSRA